MGKRKVKGESGAATNFISRNQALKKLQLSLPDFRRLCILKGIYPREPKNRKKINKGNSVYKTYYYVKDIQYIAHEPVLKKFREFKVFMRKLKRAIGRQEYTDAERIEENKPVYTLDHIVKERYPTFIDALRDFDDSLSMVFLFSSLPQTNKIKYEFVEKCERLKVEFMHYVIASRCLKKVFISVKGIYYQAEIQAQNITWVVPHRFTQQLPEDVDFRIMSTFVEFYTTMVGFINFQLYHNINLHYPPQLKINEDDLTTDSKYCQDIELNDELLAAMNSNLMKSADDGDVELDQFPQENDEELSDDKRNEARLTETLPSLFEGKKFFVSREVPRESLVFIIRCFGGVVSWDKTVALGATYDESEKSITHHVIDRPAIDKQRIDRHYIQPQWVFDCVNAKQILPVDDYVPGAVLPPHLSPFVEDAEDEYIPPERKQLIEQEKQLLKGDASEKEEKDGSRKRKLSDETAEEEQLTKEEKRLAVMMLPKKKKDLYEKIVYSKKKKASKVRKLEEKRKSIDELKRNAKS